MPKLNVDELCDLLAEQFEAQHIENGGKLHTFNSRSIDGTYHVEGYVDLAQLAQAIINTWDAA